MIVNTIRIKVDWYSWQTMSPEQREEKLASVKSAAKWLDGRVTIGPESILRSTWDMEENNDK